MLPTSELDYDLPEAAIATVPASPRDSARLLVIHRADGRIEHRTAADLPEFMRQGDLVVRNTTHVLPARFRGVRLDTGGKVEGLYLHDEPSAGDSTRCRVLLKMRRHKAGAVIRLSRPDGECSNYSLVIEEEASAPPSSGGDSGDVATGGWLVRVVADSGSSQDWLAAVGLTPLPPYILAARKKHALDVPDERDRSSYQTVFAHEPAAAAMRPEHGSVAAPTAGLHFTPELLERLEHRGILTADVVLHVGLGTFKPVETEYVEQHPMHTEWCMIPPEAPQRIRAARTGGHRIFAIGTTAARTLESFETIDEMESLGALATQILITPGYRWKHVDALLTNFHLPRSTLMAMVASLLPGGAAQLRELYTDALARGYRFYSYGDAMLVL